MIGRTNATGGAAGTSLSLVVTVKAAGRMSVRTTGTGDGLLLRLVYPQAPGGRDMDGKGDALRADLRHEND